MARVTGSRWSKWMKWCGVSVSWLVLTWPAKVLAVTAFGASLAGSALLLELWFPLGGALFSPPRTSEDSLPLIGAEVQEVRTMWGLRLDKDWLIKWSVRLSYAFGVLTIVLPARVLAATAGGGALPWDQPLTTLQNDLQGPVAHAITTAAVIGTGIMWSVSEHGTGVRKMSAVAFGGAAALGATTLMTTLFPLGGALF